MSLSGAGVITQDASQDDEEEGEEKINGTSHCLTSGVQCSCVFVCCLLSGGEDVGAWDGENESGSSGSGGSSSCGAAGERWHHRQGAESVSGWMPCAPSVPESHSVRVCIMLALFFRTRVLVRSAFAAVSVVVVVVSSFSSQPVAISYQNLYIFLSLLTFLSLSDSISFRSSSLCFFKPVIACN